MKLTFHVYWKCDDNLSTMANVKKLLSQLRNCHDIGILYNIPAAVKCKPNKNIRSPPKMSAQNIFQVYITLRYCFEKYNSLEFTSYIYIIFEVFYN